MKVKIGETIGESFNTYTGIMQGDCLIAILFFFYLKRCLIKPIQLKTKGFLRTTKYLDGIALAGTSKQPINESEKKVPELLEKFEFKVITIKTERFVIPKPSPSFPKTLNMEILISHRSDKLHLSDLDWLLYKEHVKDNTANCFLKFFLTKHIRGTIH